MSDENKNLDIKKLEKIKNIDDSRIGLESRTRKFYESIWKQKN